MTQDFDSADVTFAEVPMTGFGPGMGSVSIATFASTVGSGRTRAGRTLRRGATGRLIGESLEMLEVGDRVYVMNNELHCDMGRASVVELPREETERRWQATNPQWPIMHAVLHGVSRDQMMARHKANHLNVAYAPSAADADKALAAKAAMLAEMGLKVHFCVV